MNIHSSLPVALSVVDRTADAEAKNEDGVASLMVADVTPPTLSCTNSPTSQHSDE